jgi:hypothetical protein
VSFSAKKEEKVAKKRQYRIEQQRAVQQCRRLATEPNPKIEMILPLAEIVSLLQQGARNGQCGFQERSLSRRAVSSEGR